MIKTKRYDSIIFSGVLWLLFISFFEESLLWKFSTFGLVSVFFIPVAMLIWIRYSRTVLDKEDKYIIAAFVIYLIIQIAGTSASHLYKSITPLYRTLSIVITVIYIRHMTWTEKKLKALDVLSLFTIVAGFVSFVIPQQENGNPFFGNLNTVGAIYFSLFAVNYLQYLKTRKKIKILYALLSVVLIVVSVTRTAIFLVLLALLMLALFKMSNLKKIKPIVFFTVFITLLLAFVVCYYNIKNSDIYSLLNNISQKIFHKNFDSGRPDLWNLAVHSVGDNWLYGLGTYVELADFAVGTKTTHSVFFDIYLKNGMLGEISFLVAILIVLGSKKTFKSNNLNCMIMIVAFVILFYASVAVALIKPRSGVGLLQWALIGLPYCNLHNEKKEERNYGQFNSAGLQCKALY